jgi:hypothetical protein
VRDLLRQVGRFDLDQSSPPCRFPPPWTVDEQDDEARRIAAKMVAKLPELLRKA